MNEPVENREVWRWRDGRPLDAERDAIAAEEPLEIRVEGRPVAVMMRTPGNDEEIAAGFLLTEGVVGTRGELFEISRCPSSAGAEGNAVDVLLARPKSVDFEKLTRHVFTGSSCGVCGKATIESVRQHFAAAADGPDFRPRILRELSGRLSKAQEIFRRTGGLHAAGVFDREGEPLLVREDVGRHNAVDKVVGRALLDRLLPLNQHVLMVSGRISFEIMQKALAAGIPVVAGISAATTLAVDFAEASNQTLIGFLRGGTMNVYAGRERIVAETEDES